MYIDFKLQFVAIVAAALSLLNGAKELADPAEDAKRLLAQANQSLNEEETRFKQSERTLNQATAAEKDWQRRLAKAGADVDRRIQAARQCQNAIVASQKTVSELTTRVSQLHVHLKQAEDAQKSIQHTLLATEIVLYDMKWSVFAEWDLKTNGFNAWAEMPKGMKLTSAELSSVFQGKPAVPDWNPTELLTDCLGLTLERQCDFDLIRHKFYREAAATDRVYVSTRGLAELLSSERVAISRLPAVFSGGSTIEGSAVELASSCLRELNAVYAFLSDTAADEADRLLPEVAETIMTGKAMKSANVQIVPFKANLNYTVKPAGTTELLRYLPNLRMKDAQLELGASTSRPGFAVLVKNCGAEKRSANELRAGFGRAKPLGASVLRRALPGQTLRLFELAMDDGSDAGAVFTSRMGKKFGEMDYSQATISALEPSFLDLRESAVGTEMKRKIATLKIGQCGEAKLRRLDLNVQTGQVSLVADLQAKDKARLGEALNLIGKTVDDLSGEVIDGWKAAGAEVTKLRSELSETTRSLGQAANACSKAVGALDFAQRDLDSARKKQADIRRASGAAVSAKNEAQRQLKASSARVKDAERKLIDLAKFMNLIPTLSLARLPRWLF